MINKNNILSFENLSRFPQLIHGFSTVFFGSTRPSDPGYYNTVSTFTNALSIDLRHLIRMNQVHSNIVHWVKNEDGGKTIPETDGLLTEEKQLFLSVITADCLPVLFYDPKKNIVTAVHAGWRGLYAEILTVAVAKMKEKGSDPEDIFVGIGPSIRVCCYNVTEFFIQRFDEKFGDSERFVERRKEKIFFNLQKFAKQQLEGSGILPEHIEDGNYCTFDHTDVYSCRREGKDFGEIMGIIGHL